LFSFLFFSALPPPLCSAQTFIYFFGCVACMHTHSHDRNELSTILFFLIRSRERRWDGRANFHSAKYIYFQSKKGFSFQKFIILRHLTRLLLLLYYLFLVVVLMSKALSDYLCLCVFVLCDSFSSPFKLYI
jgi:hypothetical protein